MRTLLILLMAFLSGCAPTPALRGTGDLGIVIERASGRVAIVDFDGGVSQVISLEGSPAHAVALIE